MAKENVKMQPSGIPNWFVWVTTGGLALVIILLWLNYTSMATLSKTNYAMMQANADMNMMNGGMMRMVAKSMMGNNMMSQEDYNKVDSLYSSASHMDKEMGEMMEDGSISSSDIDHMNENHMQTRNMMSGMMN